MKIKLLSLLFVICLPFMLHASDFQPIPEDCSNSIDDNGNGVINEGCPQSAVFSVPSGTDIAAKVEDGVFTGYQVISDNLSETGNSVQRIAGTDINKSQIKLKGNATGNYYFWVLSYGDITQSGMWLNTSPLTAYPNSSTLGSVLSKRATPEWQMVCASGSYLNFRDGTNADCDRATTLSGDFDLYIRGRSGVVYICVFGSTNHNATPKCPTGPPPSAADYVILRTTNTITMDHADLGGANLMPFANASNNNTATISVKALWKDDVTNRMYVQYETNDVDIVTAMTSNDGIFSTVEDHFDLRFRNGDVNQLTDNNLYQILGNFGPFFLDANFVGGTRTTATSLNASISVSGSKMFLAFDLPSGIIAGSQFLCNANARNRSAAGVTTYAHMHGTTSGAMAAISEYGICETSNTLTVPGSPDVTAPVVSSCSAINITSNSFTAQCTTDEAGTAWVEYDLDNDSAVAGADKVTLGGNGVGATTFQLAVTGRPASTLHEWVVKVQDSAGNVGTGSIVDTTTSSAVTANLFASSTGTGDCSSGNPCKPATLLSQIVAGQIGEFAAGTYQGADEMIVPPSGAGGTALNPITIRCATDGACLIDGQDARQPIRLTNNDWWIIEGFNAANSNSTVVGIAANAENNIIRRTCAWNANNLTNSSVWHVSDNAGPNLLEDVCGFGTGRKIFTHINTYYLTVRRAWGQFERHDDTGSDPNMTFSAQYNSTNVIIENAIGTVQMPDAALGSDGFYGILGMDHQCSYGWGIKPQCFCTNSKYLGSIAYVTHSSRLIGWGFSNVLGVYGSRYVDCFEFKDIVSYQPPDGFTLCNHEKICDSNAQMKPIYGGTFDGGRLDGTTWSCNNSPCDRHFRNTTEIGGVASTISSDWTQTNRKDYDTINAMDADSANPFQSSAGNGARVCFRYVNGTLTSTKLWPWPMNSRIIAAMTAAGKTPVDVTSTMESIFGTIPAACKS